jgi:hypothetical protein
LFKHNKKQQMTWKSGMKDYYVKQQKTTNCNK